MEKRYDIYFGDKKIGTTELEKADPPMGSVFGKINFLNIESGYEFFKTHCAKNNIEVTDIPEEKLILTSNISELKIFCEDKKEILGSGISISGMDSDEFEISILGIPYPFYETQFPNHVKEYNNRFH